MRNLVVAHVVERQLPEVVLSHEFVEEVGADHCHGGHVERHPWIMLKRRRELQAVLHKDQPAGLAAKRASADARETERAVAEVPVKSRKISRYGMDLSRHQ